MNQQDENKKNWIVDIIKNSGFGFLATVDPDNRPYVRPMMPHLSDDGVLLLAVLPHSRTLKHVQNNPMVEICYLNSQMTYCRISGKARISYDLEKKELVWNNIAMLRNYFASPLDEKYHLLEIDSERIETLTASQTFPEDFYFCLTQ